MRLQNAWLAIAVVIVVSPVGYAHTSNLLADIQRTPDFRVQVWGETETEFLTRVRSYVALRNQLEKGLPPLARSTDAAAISQTLRALATRIQSARRGAKEGDFFTSAISAAFKKALFIEMSADTWNSIMDDNPGEFFVRINATYPSGKPVATVPANVLAVLPSLPDDIEYRFVKVHLILVDTRVSLILDRIPYAIRRNGKG